MSRIRTFLIGRSQECDLELDDSSVSRRHAEVILMADGKYYITDRHSTGGTFVYRDSGWCAIRQGFVTSTDRLRLGNHEMAASRLESLRVLPDGGRRETAGATADEPGASSGFVNHLPDDGLDPGKGLVRDPVTGEIIEKS